MRNILEALLRTLVLLVCSVIQVFAAIFEGISLLFGALCNILRNASGWLLARLDKGKYESKMRTIAE